jgi:hypothetical protein
MEFDGTVKGMTVVGLAGKDSGRPVEPNMFGQLGEDYEEEPGDGV